MSSDLPLPLSGCELICQSTSFVYLCVIQMNRLQGLRLTECAADNLLSVRQEVHDAVDEVLQVGHELVVPYKT
jgi:hypothetical protein